MLTNSPSKFPKFFCEKCQMKTNNKKDYTNHLLTAKHTELTNVNKFPAFVCKNCKKIYKWRYLNKNYNLFITSQVLTYRNEIVTGNYYRRVFVENNLPNTYSAFMYFKKSQLAEEFWTLVEIISKNWKEFYNKFLLNYKPTHLSMDVVFALAVKILGIEDQIMSSFGYPTFVHMKSRIQNWHTVTDDWMDYGGVYLNKKGSLKISNYQQNGIFHYTEKKFLNDHILYVYEDLYKEKINGSK